MWSTQKVFSCGVLLIVIWSTWKVFLMWSTHIFHVETKVFLKSIPHVEYAQPPFPLSTSWPCPLKPGQGHFIAVHQSISLDLSANINCHIFGPVTSQMMSHTQTVVTRVLPLVWAQAGLLVSWLPQLARHTGLGRTRAAKQLNLAEEAFLTTGPPASCICPCCGC